MIGVRRKTTANLVRSRLSSRLVCLLGTGDAIAARERQRPPINSSADKKYCFSFDCEAFAPGRWKNIKYFRFAPRSISDAPNGFSERKRCREITDSPGRPAREAQLSAKCTAKNGSESAETIYYCNLRASGRAAGISFRFDFTMKHCTNTKRTNLRLRKMIEFFEIRRNCLQ